MYKNGNPYLWFYKRYEPYDLAVELGMKEIIIFESIKANRQAWTGSWYDEKEQ
jgi:hypothetical protein